MNISVFGLGYVGTVCAGCLAAEGHTVIGVDVNSAKVDALNSGVPPVIEPGLGRLIRDARRANRLRATTDAAAAVRASEMSLICVGTPSRANGSLDVAQVARVCEEIGGALRATSKDHLVVLRSTMVPGTSDDHLIPILEKHSGKTVGCGLAVCYNPEFLREGSAVDDFYRPPKVVVGEKTPGSGTPLLQISTRIQAPVVRTSIRTAEMVKYADNAFHALKVVFANEIGNLCRSMRVDGHEVMAIFCQDTKLNLSSAYLKPGFAFGGSCLPKDLRALTYEAKKFDLDVPLLSAILKSNRAQVRLGIESITSLGRRRVGFLGMAFKPNTDDLRESPLVEVIECLLGKGYAMRIYDRHISMSRLIGANRRFIDERIPHLSALLVTDLATLLEESDVIVLGYHTTEFAAALQRLRPDQTVVDLARMEEFTGAPAPCEALRA